MLSNNAAVCIATPALSQRVHVHVIRDTPKLGVGAPSEHTALTSLVLLRCPRQRKPRGQPSLWVLCIVVSCLGSRGGLRVPPPVACRTRCYSGITRQQTSTSTQRQRD